MPSYLYKTYYYTILLVLPSTLSTYALNLVLNSGLALYMYYNDRRPRLV